MEQTISGCVSFGPSPLPITVALLVGGAEQADGESVGRLAQFEPQFVNCAPHFAAKQLVHASLKAVCEQKVVPHALMQLLTEQPQSTNSE